jgi:DNA-binding PadR family transcriptional regulator
MMTIDATRLLVLGATRQEQPATGYAIMRELTSWGVQEWASVNPGSIYAALRTLVKDGFVIEDSDPAPTSIGKAAHKNSTKYRVTGEGVAAFTDLLRGALWEVSTYRTAPFNAALCFLTDLTRDEVCAAIQERTARLESLLRKLEFDEKQVFLDETKPRHVVEFLRLAAGRLDGELTFTQALLERIRSGSYVFADQSG